MTPTTINSDELMDITHEDIMLELWNELSMLRSSMHRIAEALEKAP